MIIYVIVSGMYDIELVNDSLYDWNIRLYKYSFIIYIALN